MVTFGAPVALPPLLQLLHVTPLPEPFMHLALRGQRRLGIVSLALLLGLVGYSSAHRAAAQADQPPLTLADYRQALLDDRLIYLSVPATLQIQDADPIDLVPGKATVTFGRTVSADTATSLVQALGGSVTATIPPLNVYEVKLPESVTVADGIASLSALPGAERAEPVVRARPALVPNDPYYDGYQRAYLQQIHAEDAWDLQPGDPNIVTAVLDSGVDISNPDLGNQIWINPNPGHRGCGNDVHGCNFVNGDAVDPSCRNADSAAAPNPDVLPYPAGKDAFHGTFTSGIFGASVNNRYGIAGIVQRASIMPVRVGDCANPFTVSIANGVLYAADNGAAIINLSFGRENCLPMPSYVVDAISQAIRRGVIVVVAAGNDGTQCVESPANVPGAIAVGSTAADGMSRADFSNWGPEITVVAPGDHIESIVPTGLSGTTGSASGTSVSTPMVAGLADLLLSQNPLLTPAMVRSLIQRGATPLPDSGQPGWAGAGRIDLAASLRLVPAAYYGDLQISGKDVPDGTPVEARIGGQLCGRATTTTIKGQSTFTVFVATAIEQSGCGTPDAQVVLSSNGMTVATTTFKSAAISIVPTGAPQPIASTTSTAAPAAVVYRRGWNLVGVPAGTQFVGIQGPLYTLQAGDVNYAVVSAGGPIQAGSGYWVNFTADSTVTLGQDSAQEIQVQAPPGKYVMVGNPSASRAVSVTGADVVYSYDTVRAKYVAVTTLEPGQGAWAFSFSGGFITLQ
jgi:subtilisin family serine protease